MDKLNEYKLVINSSYEELEKVEQLLSMLKEEYSIPQKLYDDILISLIEAVTNAITHGNNKDPEKLVKINATIFPDKFIFTVEDEGEGFDPESVPDPTLPENIFKPSGRGIFVIKKLADIFHIVPPGNKIIIEFLKQNDHSIC